MNEREERYEEIQAKPEYLEVGARHLIWKAGTGTPVRIWNLTTYPNFSELNVESSPLLVNSVW
jgi:hypothetical protein